MLTLIEGAQLYLPEAAGEGDVLVAGDRIAAIGDAVTAAQRAAADRVIDGRNLLPLKKIYWPV